MPKRVRARVLAGTAAPSFEQTRKRVVVSGIKGAWTRHQWHANQIERTLLVWEPNELMRARFCASRSRSPLLFLLLILLLVLVLFIPSTGALFLAFALARFLLLDSLPLECRHRPWLRRALICPAVTDSSGGAVAPLRGRRRAGSGCGRSGAGTRSACAYW